MDDDCPRFLASHSTTKDLTLRAVQAPDQAYAAPRLFPRDRVYETWRHRPSNSFNGIAGASQRWRGLLEKHNTTVSYNKIVAYIPFMNANELRRWLRKQGCTLETHKGGSGHLTVKRGNRTSQLPMHGGKKELGTGLVRKIKKDLDLD